MTGNPPPSARSSATPRGTWTRWRGVLLSTVLAFLALGGVLPAACSKAPRQVLRVGTNVWPGYEPLYLARETGLFRPDEIRLVECSSATNVLRALRNRALDAGALTLDEVALLASTGRPLRVVAILDISNGADVLLSRPGVTRLEALRGRRVGVEATALGAYVLSRALAIGGLGRADVETVSLDASEHERAFRDGRVDAVVTFEPTASRLQATGARRLFDSTMIPGEIVDVLAVGPEAAGTKGEQVARLVAAWFAALKSLGKDPRAAAGIIAPRQNVSPEAYLESLKGLRFPTAAENRTLLAGREPALAGPFRGLVAEMRRNGLVSGPVDTAILDPRFLPAALPP